MSFLNVETFQGFVLATALGTILAAIIIALVTQLITTKNIGFSKVKPSNEEDKNQFKSIRNDGDDVWIVGWQDKIGGKFHKKTPKKIETGENYFDPNIFKQRYLKVRLWRGIPFIGTRIIQVNRYSVETSSFFKKIKWCCEDRKEKKRNSNKTIAKDLKKLLKLRKDCETFVIKYSLGGRGVVQFSVWKKRENKIPTTKDAYSVSHYPLFSNYDLRYLMKNLGKEAKSSGSIEEKEISREDLKVFIERLRDPNFLSIPQEPETFYERYKNNETEVTEKIKRSSDTARPVPTDIAHFVLDEPPVIFIPHLTTKEKFIIPNGDNTFGFHIEKNKGKSDQIGYLFSDKKGYLFIGSIEHCNGAVISFEVRKEGTEIKYSRASQAEVKNLQGMLNSWDEW